MVGLTPRSLSTCPRPQRPLAVGLDSDPALWAPRPGPFGCPGLDCGRPRKSSELSHMGVGLGALGSPALGVSWYFYFPPGLPTPGRQSVVCVPERR